MTRDEVVAIVKRACLKQVGSTAFGLNYQVINAGELADEILALSRAAQAEGLVREVGSDALREIAAERRRQVETEGWTREHDDQHCDGALAAAAACYAIKASRPPNDLRFGLGYPPPFWPGWAIKWWKPTDRRRDLIKAGALIVAEIERLDRSAKLKAAPLQGDGN